MPTLFLERHGKHLSREEILAYEAHVLRRNLPVRYVTLKQLRRSVLSIPPGPNDIPVGSINFILACLKAAEIPSPPIHYYPDALRAWFYRRIWKSSLKQVLAQFDYPGASPPIFIKPANKLKAFTGKVVASPEEIRRLGCSLNQTVWCSTPVTWLAEWRVYVVRGKIRAISCYAGDENLRANHSEIERAVTTLLASGWSHQNFVTDFGQLTTGETALVEQGEGFSIGAYEIAATDYLELLAGWWKECFIKT